jgi:hypothetical protein
MAVLKAVPADIEYTTLDYIETLAESSPAALQVLITCAINELWGAVDEGKADMAVLQSLRDHIDMLMKHGPQTGPDH